MKGIDATMFMGSTTRCRRAVLAMYPGIAGARADTALRFGRGAASPPAGRSAWTGEESVAVLRDKASRRKRTH